MPSVQGCIEHYTKLAATINEVHTCHKPLCARWLDFNTYGSDLINFSLHHYHAPFMLVDIVSDFYSSLRASIFISTGIGQELAIPLEIHLFEYMTLP